jgi:hypothetical protein
VARPRPGSLLGKPTTPSLFDAIHEEAEATPAKKVYCSWCGAECPPGKSQCDEFCERMENRKPPVVFPGNQDIPWEDECPTSST